MRLCNWFILIWSLGLVPRTVYTKDFRDRDRDLPLQIQAHQNVWQKMAISHEWTCPRGLQPLSQCPLSSEDPGNEVARQGPLWQRCHSQVNLVSVFPRNLLIYFRNWKTLTKHINCSGGKRKGKRISQVILIYFWERYVTTNHGNSVEIFL